MPKKAGIVIVILGAVLILSALLLLAYNRADDERAGQEAESLLLHAQAEIVRNEEAPTETPTAEIPAETRMPETEETPMESASVQPEASEESYDFAGVLTVPSLGLELPVIDEWSYARLRVAPCREFGTAAGGDLVIAGHNYRRHFGRLKELAAGDEVQFTDMDGTVYLYAVSAVETVQPDEVDRVANSGHDLTLYTCTPGGKTRVTVWCDRTDSNEKSE